MYIYKHTTIIDTNSSFSRDKAKFIRLSLSTNNSPQVVLRYNHIFAAYTVRVFKNTTSFVINDFLIIPIHFVLRIYIYIDQ